MAQFCFVQAVPCFAIQPLGCPALQGTCRGLDQWCTTQNLWVRLELRHHSSASLGALGHVGVHPHVGAGRPHCAPHSGREVGRVLWTIDVDCAARVWGSGSPGDGHQDVEQMGGEGQAAVLRCCPREAGTLPSMRALGRLWEDPSPPPGLRWLALGTRAPAVHTPVCGPT
eukprot:CAMPEP_0174378836 /NCGR_PEP_ID=MMETSP0811_2-20130205/122307_1 /TAXON_ID=73025 ORGANISM="Eutreptiella gymnastica-like, Strain CCMP1594" /NCGR_SAMPLE_ID=MMETSP0811_2 /ASSEMBLY_ACC=CAM_ASM_000667 /LENGTH=169 /DNA_ID=CAMNT_0015531165 /DNA_START=1320 /DNA_END=1830 /DNA_ORIENTATION=+